MRHSVCLVGDFFFPRFGGVESHLFQLAQCLLLRGHKVVIATHYYGKRTSVRWLTNGIKVYYLPFPQLHDQATPLLFYVQFPLLRNIWIREGTTIVHGHATMSGMCHEAILHAGTMGIPSVFTDHSLFGFADLASIHINKVMKFSMSGVNAVICVSHTGKENTALRGMVPPSIVNVIPNAVDATAFTPNPAAKDRSKTTIVVVSRLVYRKGVDLVVDVIPEICRRFPQVQWVIGGDGPKRLNLEEMIERNQLHDRVALLGAVKHSDVRNVLVRGDIFLNSSLTEAFCIAMVEAASCGLHVVSTCVGGVPEVLPPHMRKLAEPNADDIIRCLCESIAEVRTVRPNRQHKEVARMYNWHDVAARTEAVYDRIAGDDPIPILDRLWRYLSAGALAGKIFCLIVALDYLVYYFLEWLYPRENIDLAPSVPVDRWQRMTPHFKRESSRFNRLVARAEGRDDGGDGTLADAKGGVGGSPTHTRHSPPRSSPVGSPYGGGGQSPRRGGTDLPEVLVNASVVDAAGAFAGDGSGGSDGDGDGVDGYSSLSDFSSSV